MEFVCESAKSRRFWAYRGLKVSVWIVKQTTKPLLGGAEGPKIFTTQCLWESIYFPLEKIFYSEIFVDNFI